MAQRAPRLVSDTHYCVMGDVAIDASAAIAPGVVFKAPSGSRIVVEKGVCIAAGVCIQSRGGVLTIAAGVSLGANVLVVGHGTVGVNACVSPGSTLINPVVNAEAILPPNALVGDKPVAKPASPFIANPFVAPGPVGPKPPTIPEITNQSSTFVDPPPLNQPLNQSFNQPYVAPNHYSTSNGSSDNGVQSSYSSDRSSNGSASGSTKGDAALTMRSSYDRVYGREQVNDLISTLFPNRQSLNNRSQS